MSDWQDNYYINRTLCDVLSDMRLCCKTLNFSQMLSLVEESQILANRMESAIGERGDIKNMNEEWRSLKKKIKKLREEAKELEDVDSE